MAKVCKIVHEGDRTGSRAVCSARFVVPRSPKLTPMAGDHVVSSALCSAHVGAILEELDFISTRVECGSKLGSAPSKQARCDCGALGCEALHAGKGRETSLKMVSWSFSLPFVSTMLTPKRLNISEYSLFPPFASSMAVERVLSPKLKPIHVRTQVGEDEVPLLIGPLGKADFL